MHMDGHSAYVKVRGQLAKVGSLSWAKLSLSNVGAGASTHSAASPALTLPFVKNGSHRKVTGYLFNCHVLLSLIFQVVQNIFTNVTCYLMRKNIMSSECRNKGHSPMPPQSSDTDKVP